MYRRAKNDVRNSLGTPVSDTNRLRYVFMGDPALRLAMPDNVVAVTEINGAPAPSGKNEDGDPIVLAALQNAEIKGEVRSPSGAVMTDFEGVVSIDIYDAEQSITSNGNGDDGNGVKITFEEYGDRIFTGSAKVKGGKFTLRAALPAEVAQNYRPATMSLYAASDTDKAVDAVGLFRDFYVYGFDESAEPDKKAPTIDSFVLNHSSFRSGDHVNSSPMLIATVSDDTGLNVSTAGVGHHMVAILDGTRTFNDLSTYFTPSADGSPSGTINYSFSDLTEGLHTLKLRVWDTAGNSAVAELDFFVEPNLAPKIYDVYTDANPAVSSANFYLSHDQPNAMVSVDITVYDLMGRPVWSGGTTGRSDMFISTPVTWDLCDSAGRRVQRGIYLYRATITTDGGETYETASRRIAVGAQ